MVKAQVLNDGKMAMFIVNDITRIKRLEEEMKEMRALYFSQIIHELRTPLISILAMIDKLQNFILEGRGKTLLEIAKNSAVHLSNLINDLLDISRIENGKFEINKEKFDLYKAVEDVIGTLRFQSRAKKIGLEYQISNQVPQSIVSDPKRFKQILFNLIGNSIKFTFEGKIDVKITMMNQYLKTTIKDTGVGIKE